jgi:hypothetical protein
VAAGARVGGREGVNLRGDVALRRDALGIHEREATLVPPAYRA